MDPMFAKFILTDAMNKENEGSACIFATYRAQLKDLYKKAGDMLLTNVRDSINIENEFLTLPVDDKIVSGNYICSSIKINHLTLPVIPLDRSHDSLMSDQCVRQWVRSLISKNI